MVDTTQVNHVKGKIEEILSFARFVDEITKYTELYRDFNNLVASTGAIDRIMYEDYTIAVKPLASLLVSYIFQGPSYRALQKLEKFLTQIQEAPELHQALTTIPSADAAAKAITALDSTVKTGLEHLIVEIV